MKHPTNWPSAIETVAELLVFSFVAWLIFKSCTQ